MNAQTTIYTSSESSMSTSIILKTSSNFFIILLICIGGVCLEKDAKATQTKELRERHMSDVVLIELRRFNQGKSSTEECESALATGGLGKPRWATGVLIGENGYVLTARHTFDVPTEEDQEADFCAWARWKTPDNEDAEPEKELLNGEYKNLHISHLRDFEHDYAIIRFEDLRTKSDLRIEEGLLNDIRKIEPGQYIYLGYNEPENEVLSLNDKDSIKLTVNSVYFDVPCSAGEITCEVRLSSRFTNSGGVILDQDGVILALVVASIKNENSTVIPLAKLGSFLKVDAFKLKGWQSIGIKCSEVEVDRYQILLANLNNDDENFATTEIIHTWMHDYFGRENNFSVTRTMKKFRKGSETTERETGQSWLSGCNADLLIWGDVVGRQIRIRYMSRYNSYFDTFETPTDLWASRKIHTFHSEFGKPPSSGWPVFEVTVWDRWGFSMLPPGIPGLMPRTIRY